MGCQDGRRVWSGKCAVFLGEADRRTRVINGLWRVRVSREYLTSLIRTPNVRYGTCFHLETSLACGRGGELPRTGECPERVMSLGGGFSGLRRRPLRAKRCQGG